MSNCKKCGKYILGLEAKRYNNYCYECYSQYVQKISPIFLVHPFSLRIAVLFNLFDGTIDFLKRIKTKKKKRINS